MRSGNVPKAIACRYALRETLGSGGFGKVKLAEHLLTGELVAIKIVNKVKLGDDLPRVFREVEALKQLHHEHIAQLYEVVETSTHVYIVMEYCAGGELFEHIVARERLNEDEARTFFREIVASVAFVHHMGFAHRDIKPENFLLNRQRSIKLIDFGLCAKLNGENDPKDRFPPTPQMLQTCCGSPAYAAPELLSGHSYAGDMADAWSLGVLLYALLVGTLPFDDENLAVLYQKILSGRFAVPSFLSEESVGLLKQLLKTDPKRRITIRQLLVHPWLCRSNPNAFFTFPKPNNCQRQLDHEPSSMSVRWESSYLEKLKVPDREVMFELVVKLGISYDSLLATLKQGPKNWPYDYVTAVYLLLWRRKLSAQGTRINWRLRDVINRHAPMPIPSSVGSLDHANTQTMEPTGYQQMMAEVITHAASNDAISPRADRKMPFDSNGELDVDSEAFEPNSGWLSENSITGKENAAPAPHGGQYSPNFAFSAPAKNRAACKSSGANQAAHVFLPVTTGHMKPLTPVNDRLNNVGSKPLPLSPLMPSRSIDSIIVNASSTQIIPPVQPEAKQSPGRSGSVDSMMMSPTASNRYGKPGSTPPNAGSANISNAATPTASYSAKKANNLRTVVPNGNLQSPSATPGRRFIASIRNFFTPHGKSKQRQPFDENGAFGSMSRGSSSLTPSHPRIIRGTVGHDVTSIPMHGATGSVVSHCESVMTSLKHALDEMMQIRYDPINDWKLQCTINNDWGKPQLIFSVEVVVLQNSGSSSSSSNNQQENQNPHTVGIRRKRVRGDVWAYGRTVGTVLQHVQDSVNAR